jgi:TolA-binding protein
MSNWSGRIAFAFCIVVFFIFALVRWAQSCADPGDPFDDYSQHPDVPLEKFAQGQLGIVQPGFARSYLVVAYRYASGVPLTKDEQEAAFTLWQNRGIESTYIYPDYFSGGGADADRRNPYQQEAEDASEGPNDWATARSQVVSTPAPHISQMQGLDTYSEYLNCSNDAFATAVVTLNQRATKFGKDSPGIKEWVAAQDAVFANCGGDPEKPILPQAADSSLPELLRYDREYQIAAASMYSNQYEQAIKGFQQIAGEQKSPWHDIAPYLIARTMVRRATLDFTWPKESKNSVVQLPPYVPEQMQAAADYLNKLLAEQPNRPFAVPLQSLLDRAEFRLHPLLQTTRLSESLAKPAPDGRFYNWLCDYTWLLDRPGDTAAEYRRAGKPEAYAKLLAERHMGGLTDWIATFQARDTLSAQHALDVWRAHRESVPWLLAALSKTEANSPQVSEVLSAAERVPTSSPAYVSVFYHRMRLRNAQQDYATVRRSIDSYLGSSPQTPSVARDFLLDLRLDAASDLNDAVRFLPRETCSVDRRKMLPDCAGTLAEHPAKYLDVFPLDELLEVLHNKNLAEEEKAKFVRNVWMRAVLLGRHDAARSLDAAAFRAGAYQAPVNPEVTARLVKDYESATTPEEKEFAAVFLLQHQYAFGYDAGSKDAWCASYAAFKDANTYWRSSQQASIPLSYPPYLTDAQRRKAETEQSALDRTDSQANYYTKVVLAFAKTHPDDPRVPEALSRAVKNTSRNCNNPRTPALSKAAFELLHQRYSDTTWAKSTKYWYGEGY